MDEKILIDMVKSDPEFLRKLKAISAVDDLVIFMDSLGVRMTSDEAEKLLSALDYFHVDNNNKLQLDSSLNDVSGGFSVFSNPFFGVLEKLV